MLVVTHSQPHEITLDLRLTLSELIRKRSYDKVNHRIMTSHRINTEDRECVLQLAYFTFSKNVRVEELSQLLEANDTGKPWLRARIEHLLIFAPFLPDSPHDMTVLAAGTTVDILGAEYAPVIHIDAKKRRIELDYRCGNLIGDCRYRYLAYREI